MNDAAPDSIEQGRRLIKVTPNAAQSLTHRVAHYFERLTWRTPIHDRRLDGRHPVRLIATPVDPLPGDPAIGEALLDGRVIVACAQRGLAEIDWAALDANPVLAAYLHGFDWLRDLAAVGDRARVAPVAEMLATRWLAAHGDRVSEAAWHPALAARRLMMWTFHAPLLLSSTDLIFRSRILNGIGRAARHLDRTADKAPPGAERIGAWAAVIVAGLLIPQGEIRLELGEEGLQRALAASLSQDGGVVSRSPTALLEVVATIAMLRAAYDARRQMLPDTVAAVLTHVTPALLATVMGDGGLSSWQGGAPIDGQRVNDVLLASGAYGRPLRQSRDWGYQRLAAGGTVIVMDAAPPPMATTAEGGCASTLAFELSDGTERLIVNCGGARAAGVRLPRATAQALRSTAAHSTLTLADSNSTALHPDGTLGRGVGEVELSRQESEAGSRIDATHDGYARRFGLRHRRRLLLTSDGREVRGEDALLPVARTRGGWARRGGGLAPFALRFHLGAGVEAVATADGQAAMLRTPGGAFWQFRTRGEPLMVEESVWCDPSGRLLATQQIVVLSTAPAGGASISWALRRAR
jgi:uncharacterized heparinase superfamily protein